MIDALHQGASFNNKLFSNMKLRELQDKIFTKDYLKKLFKISLYDVIIHSSAMLP